MTYDAGGPPLVGNRTVVTENDGRYPELLRTCPGHPKKLYVLGNPEALACETVSVVGARKATPYGLACARLAARCAAEMGLGVTSGAAMGCDQAAQNEALDRGAPVLAVLGSGADIVYPPDARPMLERIVRTGGAVVSLQPWGSSPVRWAFVRRNAVIAGLSRVLVICEAGMPSGTFSTAQSAVDAGREVLAFPGSIFSPNSTGSNYLIASDASVIPVWDRKCLEVAYSRNYGRLRRPGPADTGKANAPFVADSFANKIVEALMASPTTPNRLAASLDADMPWLMRTLAKLELAGCVCRLADGRYSLTEEGYLGHNTADCTDARQGGATEGETDG